MPGIGDTLGDMQWALRDAAARGRTRYNLDRVLYDSPVPEALQHGVTHAWDVLSNPTTTPDIRPGGYDIRMRTHTGGPNAALALKTLGGLGLGYGLYRGGKALHNYLTSPSEEKTGQDMYGFSEKVAHQLTDPELDEVAWQHGMVSPSYGADHFDPVQMGIVPPSQAHRRFTGGMLGIGGAALGGMTGGAGWGVPGAIAGAALGGLGGYQLGYHAVPNQLAMRRQPSPEDTQIEQKVAEVVEPDNLQSRRNLYGLGGAAIGGLLGWKSPINGLGSIEGVLSGRNAGLLAAGANSPEQRRSDFQGLLRPLGWGTGYNLGGRLGIPGLIGGTVGGGVLGHELGGVLADYTQHRSPEDTQIEQKVGAFYGFSKEAAMAVPGLLHQMGQAAQIAAAHGTKRFNIEQALRPQNGLMPALGKAWDAGTRSLGRSQAGQNLMTAGQLGGAGLAIAGTTAAGIGIGRGIRRAIQPAQQPAQQPVQQIQPLQR